MLDFTSFLTSPTYWVLFLIFIIDGFPIIFIASMIAAAGQLNIFAVFVLSILGNFVGDLIYYFLGYYFSKTKVVKRFEEKHQNNIFKTKIDSLLIKKEYLTVFFIKIIPAFSIFGLFYLGQRKFSIKKYILSAFISCIIISGIICSLAYSGTITLKTFMSFLNNYQLYGIIILISLIVIIMFWYYKTKISNYILRKVSK